MPTGAASSIWNTDTPEACMATDLIAASGGLVVDSQGGILVARFDNAQSAGLTARRLQWAAQGFLDSSTHGSTQLSALLQAGDDAAAGEGRGFELLEQAAPGQILVAEGAGKALEDIPGFVLLDADTGLRELVWRAPEEQTMREEDEQILARLADENSRIAPERVATEEPELAAPPIGSPDIDSDLPPRHSRRVLIWIIGIAAAAVVAIVAAIVVHSRSGSGSNNNAGPVAQQPAAQIAQPLPPTQTAQPSPAAPQPETPKAIETPAATNEATGNSRHKQKPSEAPTVEPKPKSAETPPSMRGNCKVPQDEISGLLNRAELSRSRGQYKEAGRMYSSVLACEPGNATAQAGMDHVRQAMEAGSSDQ
jgi:hypothetical protein